MIKKALFKININMILFLLGIIVGTIAVNLVCGLNSGNIENIVGEYLGKGYIEGSASKLLLAIILRRVLLAAALISIMYMLKGVLGVYMSLIISGTVCGIVLSVLGMTFGAKSILIFIVLCFPHMIIYFFAAYIFIKVKLNGVYSYNMKLPHGAGSERYAKEGAGRRKGFVAAAFVFMLGAAFEMINALYIFPFFMPMLIK